MLTLLTTGVRFRLALALAAFAALCLVAPPAVLAFGHGEKAVHCLSKADAVNHGMPIKAKPASHHGGHEAPAADPSAPAGDKQMGCCGLFCLSAVPAEAREGLDAGPASRPCPALESSLPSRAPEQLDRPPISLVFV